MKPYSLVRLFGLFSAYCLVLSATVFAAVPHLIRYQGQTLDSQGVPLEGPYTLTFRLYDAETAGTKLWEEVQPNVPLSKGHFSVLLGQVSSLTTMDWSKSCWLSVQINAEPELAPRQRITSVPLAVRAERAEVAEGLSVPVTTSTITDDQNRLVPSGAIILWTGPACPAGYSRAASLDGALVKAGSVFNGPVPAGASELAPHAHPFSGSTSTDGSHKHNLHVELDTGGETAIYSTYPNKPFPDGTSYEDAAGNHSHSFSGTTSTVGSATVATLLLCQKN